MGVSPLFFCFKNKSPICASITGLISSVVSGIFLFWAMEELLFFRDLPKTFLSISFALICVILVIFITLLVFSIIKNIKCIKVGKIFCIILLIFCLISFIFMLIVCIITIKDYADEEKKYEGKFWDNSDWAVVTLPSILTLILLIVMALCANYLFKISNGNINSTSFSENKNIDGDNDHSFSQPGLGNASTGINNPVKIQQNETSFGNK